MKARNIVSAVLLLFVAASVASLLLKGTGGKKDAGGETPAGTASDADRPAGEEALASPDPDGAEHYVVAYYFHTTARCPTCVKIESYTKATIETVFADQIEAGALRFYSHNVEDPEHSHFIDDYGLTAKSVIIAEYRDGERTRWKNLGRIWEYAGDRDRFARYIEDETREYLGEPAHE